MSKARKPETIQAALLEAFAEADKLHGGSECGGTIVICDHPGEDILDLYGEGELDLPGVEIRNVGTEGIFQTKRYLNGSLDGKRVLVLDHDVCDTYGDWLADVTARAYVYSEDENVLRMRELGLTEGTAMREAFAACSKLTGRAYRKRLIRLRDASGLAGFSSPEELMLGYVCSELGAGRIDGVSLVATLLLRAHANDGSLERCDLLFDTAPDWLRSQVLAWCGYDGAFSGSALRRDLLSHVLLTACGQSMDGLDLRQLCASVSDDQDHIAFCRSVVDRWITDGHRIDLMSMVFTVERRCGLERVLADANIESLLNVDVFPCIDAAILRVLFKRVAASPDEADGVLSVIAVRRGKCWYEDFSCYYEGLAAAARMQRFYREHMTGFVGMGAFALWKAYTSNLYHMDRWYRDMRYALRGAYKEGQYGLDQDFMDCCAEMERLYRGWFIKELSRAWTNAASDDFMLRGYVEGIPRQIDFDLATVEPLAKGTKRTWVIVSDALRYEVAAELAEVLERETKGVCDLDAVQGVFPSITKCGMAALLPHGTFRYEDGTVGHKPSLDVLLDGKRVRTVEERGKAIARRYPGSVAVRYDRFVNGMDREARRDLVDGARVVYVYHDAIDAIGDKLATECKVFPACRESVDELTTLVKLIVRENAGSNVVITADHGFLYTARPLDEYDHALRSDAQGSIVEAGRRWMVARAGAESDVLMPVALPAGGGELVGFAPRGDVRLRMAGGGENYVHGGMSLQELCVPVLTFTNKRRGSRGYVESKPVGISLVTQLQAVSNPSFMLEFLQDEPVGGKVLPAVYEIFAAYGGERVSDTSVVVANLEDADAAARLLRVLVTISPAAAVFPGSVCSLVARNVDTGEEHVMREVTLQIMA